MRQQGLNRGASQENAIVLTREGLLNPPLRFPDEFVRHKVLDLIGDLALLASRFWATWWRDRAGHAMHYGTGVPHPGVIEPSGRDYGGRGIRKRFTACPR